MKNEKITAYNQRLTAFFRTYKYSLISSWIFAILAYMFVFTNLLVNADGINYGFTLGVTYESGRWGLGILAELVPCYAMPWLFGLITVSFISVSGMIICYVFGFEKKSYQIFTGALIIVFPSLGATFNYMFTSAPYGLAFFLITVSFLLLTRDSHIVRNIIVAFVLTVIGIGIYQAYISILTVLLIIYLMHLMLEKSADAASVFKKGIIYVALIIASMAVYYGITLVINRIIGVEFGEYAARSVSGSTSIFKRLSLCASIPILVLTKGKGGLIFNKYSMVFHIVCLVVLIAAIFIYLKKSKKAGNKLMFILLIICMPFALNMVYVIVSDMPVHTLVLYDYVCLYILFLVCVRYLTEKLDLKEKIKKIVKYSVFISLSCIICVNVIAANEMSITLQYKYEQMYAECLSIKVKIESMPEYKEGVKIAFVGDKNNYKEDTSHFEELKEVIGLKLTACSDHYEDFLRDFLGFKGEYAAKEEKDAIKESAEYDEMEYYPYNGSIKYIDGIIVVKLNNIKK